MNQCRICYAECGELVSLCECRGSMEFVHVECMNKWLDMSKKDHCPTCFMKFPRKENILIYIYDMFEVFAKLMTALTSST